MAKVSIVKWITNKIKQAMAIVQDGDTATRTISSGKYVLWNNNMYTANSNIASGDDLSSKLTACADGGLNELSANTTQAIAKLNSNLSELKIWVGELSFPFNNQSYCSIAISTATGGIVTADNIKAFSGIGLGAGLRYALSSNKQSIVAYDVAATSSTFTVLGIFFYT